ncbi:MAG: hypothetical protein RJB26_1092, partial [Pseudomonadota bacterium]
MSASRNLRYELRPWHLDATQGFQMRGMELGIDQADIPGAALGGQRQQGHLRRVA